VLEIISHSDGRVDLKNLENFISAYQEHTLLSLGELWALPIMLRIAVIENLRRISGIIALDIVDQNLAEYWGAKMLKTVKDNPGDLILSIAEMAKTKPILSGPFVASFTRILKGKGPALALPLSWMEQQLTGLGINSNELVWQENQKQAADQMSVSNSIGTLRFLGNTDWRKFVESLSSVEKTLRREETGTYALMDFSTRDAYRHVVERISKASAFSETEVAQKVVELAHNESNRIGSLNRQRHIGYFLIDQGVNQTEAAVQMPYTVKQKVARFAQKIPVFLYIFLILFIAICMSSGMFYMAYSHGNLNKVQLILVALLSFAGAMQLAISLINWLSTIFIKPKLLPRMDFSKKIPDEYRTMVAMPTLLIGIEELDNMVEHLEIHYLANSEANLHFALLTDFADADKQNMPSADVVLQLAIDRINALNQKYSKTDADIFFLFHRPHKWNEQEKRWMGYERKRGKLAALNTFLLNRDTSQFSVLVGHLPLDYNFKYIITLDSDTLLPREAAWKCIATMAHPLNQAVFSKVKKRVVLGYGILQPRVAANISKNTNTLYLKIHGNVLGIDPYTRMTSDVYQDLFGEGSFIGKGIYDIAIFEQTVKDAFPDNRILSHDLLEGNYVRSGLMSDVLLYEENPSKYESDIKRRHRWIRGDWQAGAWMMPFVTNASRKLVQNKLSALSRWKLLDNLRRSLLPLALLLFLLMGWSMLPFPWFWTAAVTIIILLPSMAASGWQLFHKPDEITLDAHLLEVSTTLKGAISQFVFGLAVLPYEAYRYTDAVVRTNYRMIFSNKKLLEWTPFSQTNGKSDNNLISAYLQMWIAPTLALFTLSYLVYFNTHALFVAIPILVLWLLAPALSWYLSAPISEKVPKLNEEQKQFLHKAARKNWSFFETFVNAEENWLPPDNFQEQPVSAIAHRTSPTNMGLSLLANLTAYDFGYIPGTELLHRCNNALQTMLQLERYNGHFLNWYDTRTLLPLNPRYVSTVDSGNLSGHLLTLRQGLQELKSQPILKESFISGLNSTVAIISDLATGDEIDLVKKFSSLLNSIEEPESLSYIKKYISELIYYGKVLALSQEGKSSLIHKWIDKLNLQITKFDNELELFAPWNSLTPLNQYKNRFKFLDRILSLEEIQVLSERIKHEYNTIENSNELHEWYLQIETHVVNGSKNAAERILLIDRMMADFENISELDYSFLFEKSTNLMRIGFNVDEQRKDESFYDLLASEARLAVFVGIAQGKLPQESWFALGRLLTDSGGDPILLSWSGSMFEYLMPQLVMPTYENTLLYQTSLASVKRQIEYGEQRGVPWGISESGYNTVDTNLVYQYRAFGVPGLGLKRGLDEDLVIAPYATSLALMVTPRRACKNLQEISSEGFEGEFGFYEAIDYTPSRLPRGKSFSIVQSYMAHHQGMALLSYAYVLLNKPMHRRFESERRFQATMLLLQERIPRASLFYAHTADLLESQTAIIDSQIRCITTPNTPIPEIQLLSNGRYQIMVTNSGGGYSRWKDITLTRWREDTTKDNHGIFCYIKDINSGKFWSNTFQPTLKTPKNYEAVFSQGHVEFRRHDYGIETKTEIIISPEDDTELRRIKITNRTQFSKVIEVTSYAEIVLANQASDEAHPAFSNLFVQTEIFEEHKAIICTRRPRSKNEKPPWMFHLMNVNGGEVEAISYETDRMKFIGRGNSLENPDAIHMDKLSNTEGAVLDPIVAIRYRIIIKANRTTTIDLIYGINESKEGCEALMHKYRDEHLKKRAFELFWTHSQVILRQINSSEADAQLYERLASSIIYTNPNLRGENAVLKNNFRGQSGLWSHSVSGDLPIVLLHIHDQESIEMVKQMIQAHAYWHLKGLEVDLVIWNEDHGSYRQHLQDQILGMISSGAVNGGSYTKLGSIFVKSADQLSTEDRILFESVARVILHDNRGTLSEQINKNYSEKILPPLLDIKIKPTNFEHVELKLPDNLLFFNGIGGFTQDGKQYKIITKLNEQTPAPWVNIIANPDFGSVISESGSAYTWAVNAHEYRITPWNNDPVSDIGGEAFYLRDELSGQFWSPSPFPSKGYSPYLTTHGFGNTMFEHVEQGITSEMTVFVDVKWPIKFIVLKIKNLSGQERKLSITGFMEIIMGDTRRKTNMHVISSLEVENNALCFKNRYNTPFSERVTFFKVLGQNNSFTADRLEFIGRNRNLRNPAALSRTRLSGKTGANMDPCAAIQQKFDLQPDAEKEVIFMCGNESNATSIEMLLSMFAEKEAVYESLQEVKNYWNEVMGAVQVQTPNKALNILANGWLTYQTLACRIFARSGFYQSGGAFGFRDQLQDTLALLHTKPELVRKQILLNASRQFSEGDVQHWWHPPEGRGVRTKCSDDMLWLPFVIARYVENTGDTSILNESVGFLEGRQLFHDEESLYDLPISGDLVGTVYEHGLRAIKHSLVFGERGLPLIGTGDWNDGMDQVGNEGKGESVWLAFFLYDVLNRFAEVAHLFSDKDFETICRNEAKKLQQNIEAAAWDGAWYKRAWFDDGTPLGSKQNDECRIDAIAQSWSVLSGAGAEERQHSAMNSLDTHLVRRDLNLIQLLDPPFDKQGLNPGYIKGYVPGVRENGGQYSHAAIWALMAFAKLGNREKVWELFSMVQPIGHCLNAEATQIYKVEPYVMAADVYANPTHEGRGGWTWYTGSSGWMYQFILHSLIGLRRKENELSFKPCFPFDWESIGIRYRFGKAIYNISVYQLTNFDKSHWIMDENEGIGSIISLTDDGKEHQVSIYVGT